MKAGEFGCIGALDIQFLTNALVVLDAMEKAADVRLVKAQKLLGGRSVSLIVGGTDADVSAALEAAREISETLPGKPVKSAFRISAPHVRLLPMLG